jgi:hypothetical protein
MHRSEILRNFGGALLGAPGGVRDARRYPQSWSLVSPPPLPQSFSSSSSSSSSTSWLVHKREQMCIPGTRLSARLPSCVHALVSVPRLKPKAENEDDLASWSRQRLPSNPAL